MPTANRQKRKSESESCRIQDDYKISNIPEKQIGIICNYYHLNTKFTWFGWSNCFHWQLWHESL